MPTAAEINALYYNRRKDRIGRLLDSRRDSRAERYARQAAEQKRQDAIDAEGRDFAQRLALGEQAFAFDAALQTDRYRQARQAAEQEAGFDRQARADTAEIEEMLLGERAGYDQQAAEFQAAQEALAAEQERAFEQEMFDAGVAAETEAASMQQRFSRESDNAAFEHDLQTLQAQTLAEYDLGWERSKQEAVRDGTHYFTEEQKADIKRLDAYEAKIQSDRSLTPQQRLEALTQIYTAKKAINPLSRTADEQPVPLAESLVKSIHNFEKYADLPWTLSETGEPQLPRGFSMPSDDGALQTPSGMSPKEQADAAAKLMAEKREWFKFFIEQETTTGSGDNETIEPKYTAEQAARMAELMIDPDARAAMGFPDEDTGTTQGVSEDRLSPPRPPETQAAGDTSYLDRMRPWRPGQTQTANPPQVAGTVEERHRAWQQAQDLEQQISEVQVPGTEPLVSEETRDEYLQSLPRPTSKAEFDKLPAGAVFVAPDGTIRRKA